jgi:AraC-like DNA-binding protein
MHRKPALEKIGLKQEESFVAYNYSTDHFRFFWHFHPEYELTLITKGDGSRMIGDSYKLFKSGDLVFVGPNMPHSWATDISKRKNTKQECVVIQFSEKFIDGFLSYNEFASVKKLLKAARQSAYFKVTEELSQSIQQVPLLKGVNRVIKLLTILDVLSASRAELLASEFFKPVPMRTDQDRLSKVFNFIHTCSHKTISLQQAANLINLSDSAFCKFFKRSCDKTFSDYLNELRIGHACKLLTETEKSISEIAYVVGFKSLTYFNRVFLKKKGKSPKHFRQAAV